MNRVRGLPSIPCASCSLILHPQGMFPQDHPQIMLLFCSNLHSLHFLLPLKKDHFTGDGDYDNF